MHVRLHLLIRVNKHTISLILTDRAFKRFKEIMGNIEAIDFIIMTLATKVNFYILLIQKKTFVCKICYQCAHYRVYQYNKCKRFDDKYCNIVMTNDNAEKHIKRK